RNQPALRRERGSEHVVQTQEDGGRGIRERETSGYIEVADAFGDGRQHAVQLAALLVELELQLGDLGGLFCRVCGARGRRCGRGPAAHVGRSPWRVTWKRIEILTLQRAAADCSLPRAWITPGVRMGKADRSLGALIAAV